MDEYYLFFYSHCVSIGSFHGLLYLFLCCICIQFLLMYRTLYHTIFVFLFLCSIILLYETLNKVNWQAQVTGIKEKEAETEEGSETIGRGIGSGVGAGNGIDIEIEIEIVVMTTIETENMDGSEIVTGIAAAGIAFE